jgi:nicotinamide-nucleotide amidase
MDFSGVGSIDWLPDESHYVFQGREGGEDVHSLITLCYASLRRRNQYIAFVETLTGGMLSDMWSGEGDLSRFFLGSTVAFGDRALVELLGISEIFLQNFGIVSRETALAMADGLWQRLGADFVVAVAGDLESHSSGMVWLAIRTPSRKIVQRLDFSSCATQRNLVRERACYGAVKILLQVLFEEDVGEKPPAPAKIAGMEARI